MYSTGPVHGLQVGISARPGRDGNEGNKKGSSPTSHRILEQNHVQETTCKRDPLASLAKTWRPFPVTALLTRALHTIQQTQSTPQHGRTHTKKHRPPYPRPAPSENAGLSRSFTIFAKLNRSCQMKRRTAFLTTSVGAKTDCACAVHRHGC